MLLHAAERDVADDHVREKLRLARETAAENLGETRRFIRELAPRPSTCRRCPPRSAGSRAPRPGRPSRPVSPFASSSSSSGDAACCRWRPTRRCCASRRDRSRTCCSTPRRRAASADAQLPGRRDRRSTSSTTASGSTPRASAAPAAEIGDFGLRAIRRRAEQLGGTLDIETAPGEGTALSVRIPVVAA